MKALEPKRPAEIDPLAAEVLDQLADRPEANEIVLGGHFALKHFIDFRPTHDVDALWRTGVKRSTVAVLRETMQAAAAARGLEYSEREFGDTMSMEIGTEKNKVFAFQIAVRSIELEPPIPSPYGSIAIETLADNIGAKMSALVNRGLPRDFVDIKRVVDDGVGDRGRMLELVATQEPQEQPVFGEKTSPQTSNESRAPTAVRDDRANRRA